MTALEQAESNNKSFTTQALWLSFYASGLIGSLLVYGLLQERIMTLDYSGEAFTWSVFLVFMNRAVAVVFAVGMAKVNRESMRAQAPLWKYLVVSLSNVYASTCQYEALKYVSFVLQMLGKSFKMMPVMVWGMVISGKRYSCVDWMVAALVTFGVTEFLVTEADSSHAGDTNTNLLKGVLLLGGFLALDGLTSTMQEKLFKQHSTSKYNQMFYVNLCSTTVSIITLLTTGQLMPAIKFTGAHSAFFWDAMVLSAAAVSGQFFIYSQVKEFGALVFAATMNVRQICSIILSYIMYDHSIVPLQVLGIAVTFAALFYKSYLGFAEEKAEKSERQPLNTPEKDKANNDDLANNQKV